MPGGFFPAVEPDAPVRPLLGRLRPAVHAELERTAPEDVRPLFCQGDFVPVHVLCDPSGW